MTCQLGLKPVPEDKIPKNLEPGRTAIFSTGDEARTYVIHAVCYGADGGMLFFEKSEKSFQQEHINSRYLRHIFPMQNDAAARVCAKRVERICKHREKAISNAKRMVRLDITQTIQACREIGSNWAQDEHW